MRKPILLLLALLFTAAATLEAAKVQTKHEPSMDYKKFHTYRWKTEEGPAAPDVDHRIRVAAQEELAEKGLRLAREGEEADLVLVYAAGYADILVAGWNVSVDWWGSLIGVPGGDSNVTAGIAFFLSLPEDTSKPIWAGWLVQRATTEGALQILRERAPKYTRRILAKYPPR